VDGLETSWVSPLSCAPEPDESYTTGKERTSCDCLGSDTYRNRKLEHLLRLMFFKRPAILCLLVIGMVLLWLPQGVAAPVAVRFTEGVTHGFLVLRNVNGGLLASGDLLQAQRAGRVESRMAFRFKDGSIYDETVVFSQDRVFTMQSYHLVQRGPTFTEDTEISLERPSGKYRVITKAHKDGREQVVNGALDLPPDVYNGMIIIVAKNLPKGASETVHLVAFTPTPRLIQLEFAPDGEQKVLIGELIKTASHYVLKPQLGPWLKLFAMLLGRMPPDSHAWIISDEVPAFVRFEGQLFTTGPIWWIETTSLPVAQLPETVN
jgi:hypothetical protein